MTKTSRVSAPRKIQKFLKKILPFLQFESKNEAINIIEDIYLYRNSRNKEKEFNDKKK